MNNSIFVTPEVVAQHGRTVWRVAWSILRNEPDAWDCYQQVFADAIKSGRKTNEIKYPRTYLKILARRNAWRILQGRRKHRHVQLVESEDSVSDLPAFAEFFEVIAPCLTSQQADVMWLKYAQGASYAEIAATLGISESTVGTVLTDGKHVLQQSLTKADFF